MLKSMAFTLSAITFAIGSSTAMAASTRADISISAVIPANTFHALPLNNPTFGQAETMNYNLATGTLAPLTQTYSIKSSTKSVKAYIVGGAAKLFNGVAAHDIPLTTTLGTVALSDVSQEVAPAGAATTAGTQLLLEIKPGAIPASASGTYSSNFTIVFEEGA